MSVARDPNTATRRPEVRPSKARERILATADRLFYEEGIHAVGINRVVDEAQVTRVTLYRHFPSKDDLIGAYLDRRTQFDQDQVNSIIDRHPDDPRKALSELASALTVDGFAAVRRGCPFINSSAEFGGTHVTRERAGAIRNWVTDRFTELLERIGHARPRAAAHQLMMIRTGAVVSGALDHNDDLKADFLDAWNVVIDAGLPAGR